jgi:ribosomal peptide maturation radical SAM protein 1
MDASDVQLVSMPFHTPWFPSIALGTLKAALARAGFPCRCRHYNVEFLDYLVDPAREPTDALPPLTIADYYRVQSLCIPAAGDWVFCVPPFRDDLAEVDERFVGHLRICGASDEEIALAHRMRQHAPGFLRRCADEILASRPKLVGFSTMFSQNIASLTLARMLKLADPAIVVVLGGANCDGPMGPALHRSFPWIDVVVRSEGERALVELVRDLDAGRPFRRLPGLCVRANGEPVVTDAPEPVPMAEVPLPDYDDYFELIESLPVGKHFDVTVPFETSRGCWWGEKAHCTFCGLNGSTMRYRSKSPEQAYHEIVELARRHQQLRFWAVDNIIDMDYFQTLLPRLHADGLDIKMFFETKANLKRWQVRMMRDSGVHSFQPGVESFSTPILALMRKGVTALQNIRLLKWVREYGLQVTYHVLAGFPTEPAEEYGRMAALMPSLWHLPPPEGVNQLHIDRFSPLEFSARELGLEIAAPLGQYTILYPVDRDTAMEIAYYFVPRYLDGRRPADYLGECSRAVEEWNRRYRAESRFSTLHYRRGPGFVLIEDERVEGTRDRYTLSDWHAEAFLACDGGATPQAVLKAVQRAGAEAVALDEVQALLAELLEARLLYGEGGRYLSLPIAETPDGLDRACGAAEEPPARDRALIALGRAR